MVLGKIPLGKFLPQKFPPINFFPGKSPRKISTWNIPSHFINCLSSFKELKNNLLMITVTIMKKQKIQKTRVKIFNYCCRRYSRWKFSGGDFPRGSLIGGNFPGENFPRGTFLELFSSYIVSVLIFQKMINKYKKTFNKKIYTLNS